MITTRTEPGRSLAARALWIAAAAGPALLGAFTLVALILGAAGRHPMWQISDPNLSEAAATRDTATVMLLLREGHDPNLSYLVRGGVLDRGPVRATPVEAALGERRLEVVDILLRHGATVTEAQRVEFTCAARVRGDDDIARFFEERGGPVTCESKQSAR